MSEVYPFNLNHLRYFYEVARAGNMRRAATRIGISQPALSKQIQALEEAIGLQLFYRSSRGLQPTPDGEIAFAHCERVFGHIHDLEEAIEALRTGSAGRVTLGAIYSISVHLLPGYIKRFRQTRPKVRVRITSARSANVLQALREHVIDVGFVAGRPESDDFVALPFLRNPLVVVAAPGHPFAQAAAAGQELFADVMTRADMVCFDRDAPTRHFTEGALDELGVEPRVVVECPSIETIKKLVREGLGFAVLPGHCVVEEVAAGSLKIIPVSDWNLQRCLYVVYLAGPALTPAVRQFIDLFDTIDDSPG